MLPANQSIAVASRYLPLLSQLGKPLLQTDIAPQPLEEKLIGAAVEEMGIVTLSLETRVE